MLIAVLLYGRGRLQARVRQLQWDVVDCIEQQMLQNEYEDRKEEEALCFLSLMLLCRLHSVVKTLFDTLGLIYHFILVLFSRMGFFCVIICS